MYGLAAIQQANGWAMALAGACIVMSGLSMLAFLISMLPRLTGLFEKKTAPEKTPPIVPPPIRELVPEKLPDNLDAVAAIYSSLTQEMGAEFSLVDLHKKSKELNLPHPHLSINRFREAGMLIPKGEGRFSWQLASEQ